MRLARLLKSGGSGEHGCPAVYTTEDPEIVVVQGVVVDDETRQELVQVSEGETAVAIPVEMLLRAASAVPGPERRTP